MSNKKAVRLSENALEIAKVRYFSDGETWETCIERVSNAVADIEKDKNYYKEKFFDMLYNMDFLPGGRILRNAGKPKGSMLNCYVCPIDDAIESIGQFMKDALTLWSEGGGVGCNFSHLRPKGDPILGKGGFSSGLVSFLEACDAIASTIESGGQRRAAALAAVDISHPEVVDFINAKLIDGKLSHFNISVLINDDFIKAVERNEDWTFTFNKKKYHSMPARELWDLIIKNMCKSAEPGILNSSNLFKNNSYYFAPISATNPCLTGETLISLSDGKYRSIRELAEEGKDILVKSFNTKTNLVEDKWMRNPRITGKNEKILKITLSGGATIRCTENHKFYMTDLSLVKAKDLMIGNTFFHFVGVMGSKTNNPVDSRFMYDVIDIKEDGIEDVYNGTVDDNHNYYIMCNTNEKDQYYQVLSKNCGEIPLENYGACCLGSLVLPNFITGTTNTNWQKLEKTIRLAIRFLDNVVDVNKYTLREIDINTHNSRRIGLGIMGLADYLFAKQLRYGSKEALEEIEKLMRYIRDVAYEASVELAEEKGSFPKFDSVNYGNASFIRKLPTRLRMMIKEKGIRNCSILTCPPTGTTSLLSNCVGGIEPLMFKSYKRRDRVSERIYIHPKYNQLLLSGEPIPDWFVDSSDLSPKDHIETQIVIQRYLDNSVSKTINCKEGTTPEEIDSLLLESAKSVKGITIYVDGSKYGQVYESLSEDEALEYLAMNTVSNVLSMDDVECNCQKKDEDDDETNGSCELPLAV